MGKILFNEKTFLDAKNKVDTYNSQILEAMNKINLELSTIDKVISTPNFNKTAPTFIDYFNEQARFVSSRKDSFNNTFNLVSNGYYSYTSSVNNMVGGEK